MNENDIHGGMSAHATHDVADFAADLRRLRLEAGSPTLAHLQHLTGISRTVISEALSGRTLPSERTVNALVRVLGGDPPAALRKRAELARGGPAKTASVPVAREPVATVGSGDPRPGDALAVTVATFAAGCLVSVGSWAVVRALGSRRTTRYRRR
ncbi:helix-turn-helix transcriptional regulator [Microbacterium sp. B19]|uniref:helix-turn-helix domain-containing protein n=1 Tax=Microbacterium sp. B19 TaxID=96765 RepID=UPI00034D7E5A|nr:helix-turn-helix transcriptional regulator [Microbacterium sp. B19]